MLVQHLDSVCVVDDEGCDHNMDSMFDRGLPLCKKLPERADKLAVVGAGPSARDYIEEIKEYPEVWTVNGAYGFLLESGIVADGFVAVDPLPELAEYVRDAQPETTFYIGAFCDPSVFDALDGFKVEVWFPAGHGAKYRPGTLLVPGGTTALTRAPALAYMLGWRDVTIYGGDSSFDEWGRYAYESGLYKADSNRGGYTVMCNGEGPFYTEEALLRQACQFGCIAQNKQIDLKFRCKGLLDAFIRSPTLERDIHDEYNEAIAQGRVKRDELDNRICAPEKPLQPEQSLST